MAGVKKALSVVGAVAVIRLKDGGDRYLYRGAIVDPEGFDEKSIAHVTGLGLVAEVEVATSDDTGPAFPEGDPSEEWSAKQLDAYAESKGFDIGSAKTKPEKVAAIAAAASA